MNFGGFSLIILTKCIAQENKRIALHRNRTIGDIFPVSKEFSLRTSVIIKIWQLGM
jgi:hypothetical protein